MAAVKMFAASNLTQEELADATGVSQSRMAVVTTAVPTGQLLTLHQRIALAIGPAGQ